MSWKLVPPRKDKSPYWYVRGTYCDIRLDRSTGTGDERAARRILKTWKQQAERGQYGKPIQVGVSGTECSEVTFARAAAAYMRAGGEAYFLTPILKAWPNRPLSSIDQMAVDSLATTIYPNATPATRNRQLYTPISAVMKHVGFERRIRRPKGANGSKRTFWLDKEPTFRLLAALGRIDAELGIMCTLLNYTGMRLSEAMNLQCENVDLSRSYAYVPDTKTGEPRAVHLPPICVMELANHPRGIERRGKVFRFGGQDWIRDKLFEACKQCAIVLPRRTAFHLFRHNYGTWMRLYGGLDAIGLTRTGVWADLDSVERYAHSETTAEARRADELPVPGRKMG